MAEDMKYVFRDGKFINRMTGEAIPEDEPVMVFRGRDIHAIPTLEFYRSKLKDPVHHHNVDQVLKVFHRFRILHPERMKEPGPRTQVA